MIDFERQGLVLIIFSFFILFTVKPFTIFDVFFFLIFFLCGFYSYVIYEEEPVVIKGRKKK